MWKSGILILWAASVSTLSVEDEALLSASTSHDVLPFMEMGRIINGDSASRGQFPWQAALYLSRGSSTVFCGGSLISNTFILTAAHCTRNVTGVTAYLGVTALNDTTDRVTAQGTRLIVHGSYDPDSLHDDIALIELSDPVRVDGLYVRPIPLTSREYEAGELVTISGWGKISDESNSVSQSLNYASFNIITRSTCEQTYGSGLYTGVICIQGRNSQSTCSGDSGSPGIIGFGESAIQVGVHSFGHVQGCTVGHPVGDTSVAHFRQWIAANAGV